ncbi:hypothetical protein [Sporolactobacillus spathodeae]|uniref:Uncharacterized protein n=1 Tax=Sporolactobacillus spathodeae TaxID=1465502 RepID=A0ABS2Q7N5_9BACL|nr:hypothetical protein [Sporolactobacillus spathodeae]MBM7657801.1 hypothetical protein [Sporolactobacillus spathodeae]
MNKYIFYLRPPIRRHGSLVYFSVFAAPTLQHAARAFADYAHAAYCGFLQLAKHKSEVYFTQGQGDKAVELVYVVIEEISTRARQP